MVHLLIFKNIICWLIHIFRWFFFLSKKQQTASSLCLGFPGSSAGKESACNAGDPDSTPGSGRAPGEGIGYPFQYSWAFLVAQMVKNPLTMQETWVQFLAWEDPLEEDMATHSSILDWRIPMAEEPGGLQSMESQRVGHNRVTELNWLKGFELLLFCCHLFQGILFLIYSFTSSMTSWLFRTVLFSLHEFVLFTGCFFFFL